MPAMDQPVGLPAPFAIAAETIAPGDRRTFSIPVSRQLTGLSASLALQVLHGAKAGPAVFVSAAIHGDELNGIPIIQKLAQTLDPAALAGTLILAPAVNVFGLANNSRYLPDRRDLNRSFPGSARGSLAAQLAHVFLEHVIARCSLGIDLHTAAVHRYNLPQIRIASGSPYLVELAMAFGAPVIVESPLRDGSMRELAHARGTPMLLYEAGEALRFDRLSIDIGTQGVMRVLAHLGMVEADDGLTSVGIPARANRSVWVRAPRGGITRRLRRSGDPVRAGDLLAEVAGLFGEEPVPLESPIDGIVIGHATLPVVNQGDALFHIAAIDDPEQVDRRIDSITDAIRVSEPQGEAQPLLDEDEVI
ncbi:succinylglutamate desuccinylase/aspartoacylase family protein [Qipengyuania sediminis]|uniref:succinylglutamate desuccinylase/aspartoacylase family protein n=1 Tax=Qipengyuania sediminis TaxID=1532023 RepID=UPI001F0FAF20|nr:succinylglutamate desuccinylase/aspartoacylase family protein [Qipengyuania sediminis]